MGHTDPRLRDLQRHVGYFYIVALGKRKQYALAADEASRWLAFYNRREERATPAGPGSLDRVCQEPRRPDERDRGQRAAQGDQADRRLREPGRSLRLSLQERCPRDAQEVQAQRGAQGRGHPPHHLRRRGEPGQRGHRLSGLGQGDRPAQGRHPQGRPDAQHRQGQPRALLAGLLLLQDQPVLRGRRPGRAPRPPLSAGRARRPGERDRHAIAGRRVQHLHRDRPHRAISIAWSTWRPTRSRPGPTKSRATPPA